MVSSIIDGVEEEFKKHFYLHYNFPAYSVGETRRIMGPGRREIGHGMLAERSLNSVLPEAFGELPCEGDCCSIDAAKVSAISPTSQSLVRPETGALIREECASAAVDSAKSEKTDVAMVGIILVSS